MTALLFMALALTQDPSRLIQEQQQREAIRVGEEQRRQIMRDERRREEQYREEMELAKRRREEAEAAAKAAPPAEEPLRRPAAGLPAVQRPEPNSAEYVNSPWIDVRTIGIAMMAFSAVSIAGLLVYRRFTF